MGSLAVEQPLQAALWTSGSLSAQLQRLPSSRSTTESPPAAKKFLCSLATHDDAAVRMSEENRSILKRDDGQRTPRRSWPLDGTMRKVNFEQNVAVVVYDRVDGDYVGCEYQQLNTEPKDRRQFMHRALMSRVQSRTAAHMSRQLQPSAAVHQQSSSDKSSARSRPLPPVLQSTDNTSSSSVEYTFHEDNAGQLWLRFTVPLGPGVSAGDALVKANVAGNKVRVLGTRTTRRTDASISGSLAVRDEFTARYALPMDVDPYAISARMDSTGNLFVEAPVITAPGNCRPTATDSERRITASTTDITNSST